MLPLFLQFLDTIYINLGRKSCRNATLSKIFALCDLESPSWRRPESSATCSRPICKKWAVSAVATRLRRKSPVPLRSEKKSVSKHGNSEVSQSPRLPLKKKEVGFFSASDDHSRSQHKFSSQDARRFLWSRRGERHGGGEPRAARAVRPPPGGRRDFLRTRGHASPSGGPPPSS